MHTSKIMVTYVKRHLALNLSPNQVLFNFSTAVQGEYQHQQDEICCLITAPLFPDRMYFQIDLAVSFEISHTNCYD